MGWNRAAVNVRVGAPGAERISPRQGRFHAKLSIRAMLDRVCKVPLSAAENWEAGAIPALPPQR